MSRPTFARAPALVAVQSVGRGAVWILGLGAFGLAFSITVTAAYLPPLLGEFTGSKTLIALVLGAEGVFALTLPLVIGPWSDHFHTPLGRRRRYGSAAPRRGGTRSQMSVQNLPPLLPVESRCFAARLSTVSPSSSC